VRLLLPFKAVYWRLRIVHLSLRWVRKFNLGDRVVYRGEEWTLIQGHSAPTWELHRGDGFAKAHEREFRKVRALSNYLGSFRSGYRFYMGYWYAIWMNEGVKPWMRACSIWGKRRTAQ
jgi:hypothetical protein